VTVIATGFQRTGLPQVEAVQVSAPLKSALPQGSAAGAAERRGADPGRAPSEAGVSLAEGAPPPPPDDPAPETSALRFDFEPEQDPGGEEAAGNEPQIPPAAPQQNTDVYSLDEFETPALLRRERKLFQ